MKLRCSLTNAMCIVIAMTLISTVMAVAPTQEKPPTGPQTYELRCRGGGLYLKDDSGAGRAGRITNVTVDFKAGTQPSGSRMPTNLQSGQCSWVDRGFRKGEPTQIRLQKHVRDYTSMQETLAASDKFWVFYVYNTNNGYMASTRDYEWVPNK